MKRTSMFLQVITGLSLLEVAACCGKVFTSLSGTIASPGYDSISSYANNLYCDYDIKMPPGNPVRLSWSSFNVKGEMPSCSEDYVEIFIGCSRHSIGRYCSDNSNSLKPFDVYSDDQCLRLRFRSDSSTAGTGFRAYYSSFSYSLGPSSLDSNCFGTKTLRSSHGLINSPSWPSSYPSLKDCYWKIEVGSGKGIKIAFMDFDLDYKLGCEDDKVKVKGGDNDESYDSSDTIKNSMCGLLDPFYFTSTKDRIWIRFKSDSFKDGRGFVAGYVIYDKTASGSSGNAASVSIVAGSLVPAIIFAVIACCVYRMFWSRKRLAIRQQRSTRRVARAQAMNTQLNAPPQEPVVHYPPPHTGPEYGTSPGAGCAPPPPLGYGPPSLAGPTPPSYNDVMAATYSQQGQSWPYRPTPQERPPLYTPEQPGGAAPYPPGQPGGAAPYPGGQPGGAPPYSSGQLGGAAPYPPGQPEGTAPYPGGQPGGAPPYSPGKLGGAAPYPNAPPGPSPQQ